MVARLRSWALAVWHFVSNAPLTYAWLVVLVITTIIQNNLTGSQLHFVLLHRSTNIAELGRDPREVLFSSLLWIDGRNQLRARSSVPVIMVTARDSEIDKVVGLELGADDYVTKPYSARELIARIRAVLRRGGDDDSEMSDGVLESGPVRMDVERHVVSVNGDTITLPLKEFDLLEYLMRNSGRVLTRGQLIDRVWGADYVGDTKTLDVHVKRLRSKIEADPANPVHLVTVRGLGYKLEG